MRLLALILAAGLAAQAAVTVEKTAYKGWPNCYRVSNGEVELVVTGDVGPRIIRFGFVGGQNLFKEVADQLGKSGEAAFQLRGGHRVWKAPEDPVASWAPDNVPVEIQVMADGLLAREPVEPLTKLQKEIEIHLAATGTEVTVIHRIANHSLFPLEYSVWAMSVMAQNGVAVTSFPPRAEYPKVLPASNPLVMWPYTDLSDKRFRFTRKYLSLRQDPANAVAEKIGMYSPDNWAAYVLNGEAFVKKTRTDPSKTYPDFGCTFETFTNADMLEMETVSPMTHVQPEKTVEHVEEWSLHRGVRIADWNDAELDRVFGPIAGSR